MMMNVVDRGELQAMWEELAGKVGHCDHSLSANHAYLKTLYSTLMSHQEDAVVYSFIIVCASALYRVVTVYSGKLRMCFL